jgi:zinc protease
VFRFLHRIACILTLGLMIPAGCAAAKDAGIPELEFEQYELSNGLRVILHQDSSLPDVAVNMWVHVGSRNEKPGLRGFAHIYEHMMFKGSGHHTGDYLPTVQGLGGRANGMTDKDRTVYWALVSPDQLETALWLESDRMGFLLDALTQDKLDNQISVVLNELRKNANEPYAESESALLELLFPSDHPYSWTVAGVPEELTAATLEDVSDFFRRYYVPNNASLCVAGNFESRQAKEWIEKYFGSLPPGPAQKRWKSWLPVLDSPRWAEIEDDVELPRVTMAWHTPARYHPLDGEFDILANILGGRKSSRLQQILVQKLGLAQSLRVRQRSRELGSTFEIEVTAAPGVELLAIEEVLVAELHRIRDKGVSNREMEIARNMLEADFLRGLERVGGFGGRANLLNRYTLFLDDPGFLASDIRRIRQATPQSVRQAARSFLGPDQKAVLHIVPGGTLQAGDAAVDRSVQPPSSGHDSFTAPGIQRGALDNGLEFYLVERHGLPLVEMHVNIKGGYAADDPSRPGNCAVTAEMLDEGADGRNALAIATDLDRLGADLECTSNFDASLIRLNIQKKNLVRGLELVGAVIMKPDFPVEEFQRIRQSFQGRQTVEADQPRTRAIKELQVRIFGAGHPYSQPYTGCGTSESLANLEIQDLRKFHADFFRPGNTAVVLVGDLTLEEARNEMDRAFGSWRGKGAADVPSEPARPVSGSRIIILDRPGSLQSTIVGGFATMPRAHPDRQTFRVLNHALGGNYSGRINRNLRSEKGYTYSARSRLVGYRDAGFFLVEAPVQIEHTAESLNELIQEIEEIGSTRPLRAEELATTQRALVNGFPRQFETLEEIATSLDRMLTCGLPLDDWQTTRERISLCNPDTVQALVDRHFDPESLVWIIVGDWGAMQSGFSIDQRDDIEVRPF